MFKLYLKADMEYIQYSFYLGQCELPTIMLDQGYHGGSQEERRRQFKGGAAGGGVGGGRGPRGE